jgi:NADPH:quinone reductase-like Zn-dependent oxidoreductase
VGFKPVIDTVFNLDDTVEAQRKMEDKKQFGKIVLSI